MRLSWAFILIPVLLIAACKKDKHGNACHSNCKVVAVSDSIEAYTAVYNYDTNTGKLLSNEGFYYGFNGTPIPFSNNFHFIDENTLIVNEGAPNAVTYQLNNSGYPTSSTYSAHNIAFQYSNSNKINSIIHTTAGLTAGTQIKTLKNIRYNSGDLVSADLSIEDSVYATFSFEYDQSKCHANTSPTSKFSCGLPIGYQSTLVLTEFQPQAFSDHLLTKSTYSKDGTDKVLVYEYSFDTEGNIVEVLTIEINSAYPTGQEITSAAKYTYDCP